MSSDTAITITKGIDKVDIDTSSDNKSDEVLQQTCAECGKQGTNLNMCNKCKSVTYCNAACKKSLLLVKSVQSASYHCQLMVRIQVLKHAVDRLYVMVVYMR